MFLADRYVVGECPKCGHPDARGDECPSCGSWLDPLKIVAPRCGICGTTPELRETVHWYLDLLKLRDERIGAWFQERTWKPNVAAFVTGLLDEVRERTITRDMKWGVQIPPQLAEGEEGKVLYVWFDAPIGYVSFTREWADAQGTPDAWKDWWRSEDTRLVHFIGKDNISFHCLLFPAMLYGVKQGYVLPWAVPANEFYNLQGRKFSTSGGWSIDLDGFFDRYDAEAARFYLLTSAPETADSEWRWEGFQECVNVKLADTIGNLVTRVLRFVAKNFEGVVPALHADHEAELDRVILTECGPIADPGEEVRAFRFRAAAELLVANARVANVFVDRLAPWALRKEDPVLAASVLATCCQYIALIARWMAPFLPNRAQALWEMLGSAGPVTATGWPGTPEPGAWRALRAGTPLGEVRGLFEKIDDERIAEEVEALRARAAE
jgi:methionyl-tRNA synthetase